MSRYINITFLAALLLLLNLPGEVSAGRITGTVKVRGLRSPANVLIYVTKAPPTPLSLSGTRFIVDQRNLTFIPHILPILVGSTVEFPNNDKVNHNVFSLSRAKKFNLGSYEAGEMKTVLFDKPGIVELRCDVHAEMAAYILVLKNPFWAVTDDKGRFEIPDANHLEQHGLMGIKDLPPGKYFIKAWHEKLKTKRTSVVVPEDGEISVLFELTRGTPSVLYK